MAKREKKNGGDVLHVALLIDESGSMSHLAEGVIAGVNEFVAGLKGDEGETTVRMSLSMFDLQGGKPPVREKYSDIPLAEVGPLGSSEYEPRGMTPLNDAVVRTIRSLSAACKKDDRAMVVILTDGLENASETTSEELRKAILQREKDGWEFVYLGANQDTWSATEQLGISQRGKHFAWEASSLGVSSALRASSGRVNRAKNAPEEYRIELDELDDRIRPGDDEVGRIARPKGSGRS